METIYAIVHCTRREAYVGRTSRPLTDRWAEHLSDAANPAYRKQLAEALRHDPQGFDIIECSINGDTSEAEWLQRFIDDGYCMLNEAAPARRQPKARDTQKEREWRALSAPPQSTDMQGLNAFEYALALCRKNIKARGELTADEGFAKHRSVSANFLQGA